METTHRIRGFVYKVWIPWDRFAEWPAGNEGEGSWGHAYVLKGMSLSVLPSM